MKPAKTTIEIGNQFKEVEIYYDEVNESHVTIAIDKNQVTVFQQPQYIPNIMEEKTLNIDYCFHTYFI